MAETYIRSPPATGKCFWKVQVGVRLMVFATAFTSIVVMVSSKQTHLVSVPGLPIKIPVSANYNDSPAFIYFVVALSVVALYSLLSVLGSYINPTNLTKHALHLVVLDAVMLGLSLSATSAAGGIAYVGFKGNSNVNWDKICNTFHKFCRHIGVSLGISLISAILILLLIVLSTISLHSRLRL